MFQVSVASQLYLELEGVWAARRPGGLIVRLVGAGAGTNTMEFWGEPC